ncbi:MAG: PQQ-binding-like beta-propeller repeat protein, partial [Pirellulales bacterium]
MVFGTLALQAAAGRAAPPDPSVPENHRPGNASQTSLADGVSDLGTRKAGHDWPAFLGPTGDSKSAETGIVTQWPPEGPRLVWQQAVGGGYAMPAISRGRLFQFSRHGGRARLTAMHSESGEHLWEFEYPTDYQDLYGYDNGPRSAAVVDGDRVYIYGAEGMLHCLRVADGKLVWKVDTARQFGVVQNFFGVGSCPVIEGDLLIAVVGGSPPASRRAPPGSLDLVRPDGTAVVAFDKFSGEVRYQAGDDLAGYASPALATMGNRRWCFVFAREGLLGFEPASGRVDFHYPWRASLLESVNASNPVVVGDLVFISETYGPGSSLLKVRPGGYELVWSDEKRRRDKSMQTHWNTPIHHEGFLYGSSGRHSENAELRCIELASGKVMWSKPGLTLASLLYIDGHFVCLTEMGRLLLIRATPERFEVVAEGRPRSMEAGPSRPAEEP